MAKQLRVGMIGYGFMGRAHSNAYKRLNDFFDVEHRPVLAAACARKRSKVEAFAANWGYERVETDWRSLVEADGHRFDRYRCAEPFPPRYRCCGGASRQDGALRKASRHERGRGRRDDRGRREGQRAEHGLVQLPPCAVHRIGETKSSMKAASGGPSTTGAAYLQDWTIAEDVPQGGAALWRLDANVAGSGVTGDPARAFD